MSRLTKQTYYLSPPKDPKLWHDSPCSLSFTNKLPYIEQASRFQHNSIYYRDDPCKPARKIDEFQKPDLLLLEFRRSIREAEKNRGGTDLRSSSKKRSLERTEYQMQASLREQELVDRLCPKNPPRLKLEYDLYGNRSSFYVTEKQKAKMLKSPRKSKKSIQYLKRNDTVFTQSQRIDMSRPQNFNPGPGTYFPIPILLKNARQSQQGSPKKSEYKTIEHPHHHKNTSTLTLGKSQELRERTVLASKTIVN